MPEQKDVTIVTDSRLSYAIYIPAQEGEKLIKQLTHKSWWMTNSGYLTRRIKPAEALGKLAYKSAVPDLIKALSDSNSNVCAYAAVALDKLVDKSHVPLLTKALSDSNQNVREYAARTLKKVGS